MMDAQTMLDYFTEAEKVRSETMTKVGSLYAAGFILGMTALDEAVSEIVGAFTGTREHTKEGS